jgi:hypothetical protein
MPSWILEDDCLLPGRYVRIIYNGPNPFSIYQSNFSILQRAIEIDASDYWERDFRWDISSDPRSFYVRIIVEKKMDARSVIYFEIIMQGNQPSDPSKNGSLTINVGAKLKTEYKLDTPFQQSPFYKSLLWLYNFLFYFRIRRDYIRMCNDWVSKIIKAYRTILKLE